MWDYRTIACRVRSTDVMCRIEFKAGSFSLDYSVTYCESCLDDVSKADCRIFWLS